MARTPLPITMTRAASLFRDGGIELAAARLFLSRSPRLQCQIPSGNVAFGLVGDKQRPPHLVRADMTIQPSVEPAELASTLGPWYRLADAVSASTEVQIYYSTADGMVVGTGGQWWAWRFANPKTPPPYGLDVPWAYVPTVPWEFDHTHVPLDRNEPHGPQLVFTFRRWTGKPQYLRIQTQTYASLTGSLF